MSSIYQEIILDHFHSPRNTASLKYPTRDAKASNPLCGDECSIQLTSEDKKVMDVCFRNVGCAISTASASILSEFIKNKSEGELIKMDKKAMISLIGIKVGPSRLKCMLLPLECLHTALLKNT